MTIPIRLEATRAVRSANENKLQLPRRVATAASATSAALRRQQLKTMGPKWRIAEGERRLLIATHNAAVNAAKSKSSMPCSQRQTASRLGTSALIRAAFPTSHFADHDGLPGQSSSFVIIPILAQRGEQAAPTRSPVTIVLAALFRAEVRGFGVREYLLLPTSAPAEPAPNMHACESRFNFPQTRWPHSLALRGARAAPRSYHRRFDRRSDSHGRSAAEPRFAHSAGQGRTCGDCRQG